MRLDYVLKNLLTILGSIGNIFDWGGGAHVAFLCLTVSGLQEFITIRISSKT